MKSFPGVLICTISVLILGTAIIRVESIDAKCKGVDIKISEENMMNIKECMSAVGASSVKDLNPDNAGCFSKCAMEKKGLIDAEGKPHKENINQAIDTDVPEEFKTAWKAEVEKCLDTEGPKVNGKSDDPKCSSFLPLSMCVHMAFLSICK